MKKYWVIILILFVSIIIRFYKLGQVPHGMTWDEAAIGYNGYALLTTRRDEWLVRLPVSFQSFGDYKAPLAIYINGIFTYLFGMNLMAVRMPFAIAGVLAVLGIYLLTKEVFIKDPKRGEYLGLLAAALLTISPWHIHYSRAGFESGLAMAFIIWAIWFLGKFFDRVNLKTKNIKVVLLTFLYLFSATVLFVATLYTYHSAKIFTPLLLILSLIVYFKKFWHQKIISSICLILAGLMLYPLLIDTFQGEGLTRANTLIFSQGLENLELIKTIISNYLAHFSPKFLLMGETTTLRHGTGRWGVLYPTSLFFLIWILLRMIQSFFSKRPLKKILSGYKFHFLAIAIILIGIIPAAIGTEIPHSNRALLSLLGYIALITLGVEDFTILVSKLKINKQFYGHKKYCCPLAKMIIGLLALTHLFSYLAFHRYYYTVFAKQSADDFKDGYLEAFRYAINYEKGINGKPQADKILFSSDYGQPYIYALFARQTNPIWYQGGSLIKYEFTSKIDLGDLSRFNTLIVANIDDDIPIEEADKLIYGSDGQVKFKIYYRE
jgi:4-amino-4-deoxy-L-arabinose transferase-like glycosyltransferase